MEPENEEFLRLVAKVVRHEHNKELAETGRGDLLTEDPTNWDEVNRILEETNRLRREYQFDRELIRLHEKLTATQE